MKDSVVESYGGHNFLGKSKFTAPKNKFIMAKANSPQQQQIVTAKANSPRQRQIHQGEVNRTWQEQAITVNQRKFISAKTNSLRLKQIYHGKGKLTLAKTNSQWQKIISQPKYKLQCRSTIMHDYDDNFCK